MLSAKKWVAMRDAQYRELVIEPALCNWNDTKAVVRAIALARARTLAFGDTKPTLQGVGVKAV